VLKAAIHGREAHVRDLVEPAQLLHDEIADHAARHLALAERLQRVRDVLDAALDVLALDGALLQRAQESGRELRSIERLAAIVALDDVRHDELRRLERREALAALEALAPPTHLPAFAREPRIDDFGVLEVAEGAM